ncbi:MAG: exodeoxyribonuclease VII small subunit [Bacteroidales bacterium]|nr:exodeoxyribonuclease VII small subunit [Bacteroidales bacterium]
MEENAMTYNQAISELEEIVRKMQAEDCDIDDLATYTARSLDLLKMCKNKLLKTDQELQKILEELK